MIVQLPPTKPITYPDDDGLPMSNNTEQFNWIVTIKENLEYLFAQDNNVFVAGDLLWYPIEGNNTICNAPDAMVVFGRPKGRRGSYMQWQEGDIAPQVVFEILSPGNRAGEMDKKMQFYDRHGVEEYYIYDPDRISLTGWQRVTDDFEPIANMHGWVSPRLGIRFALNPELVLYFPDGSEFSDYVAERQKVELEYQRANQAERETEIERQRANQAERETEMERQRANQAERESEVERQRAEMEHQRANQLAERLRSLGIEV
jgi:Uma2 family endonuclease